MNYYDRQKVIIQAEGNDYYNKTEKKRCLTCGEKFAGDETVRGELCFKCDSALVTCERCGERFKTEDETHNICPTCRT